MTHPASTHARRFQCRHIFTDGHRCGSPCLRDEDFCFYHLGLHAQSPLPTADLSQGEHRAAPFTLPIPDLNDRSAVQLAIGQVLNRLASNELDPRRAGLLLYGLQIASLNLPRAAAPATAPQQASPVEEIVSDPNLGRIALRTELPDPGAPRPNSLIARLLEALELTADPTAAPTPEATPEPQPTPTAAPTPTTLPDLNAAAEPITLPNLNAATEPGAPTSPAKPASGVPASLAGGVQRVASGPARTSVSPALQPSLAILEGHAKTHRPHHPRRLGLPPRNPRQRHRPGPQTHLQQAPPRLPQHASPRL